jgi:hypothetical protein
MKRPTSDDQKAERPFKRKNNRPFNITVGLPSTADKEKEEAPLLGSKTKGAVYLRDKPKEKQRFGNFNYGNYHSYYT